MPANENSIQSKMFLRDTYCENMTKTKYNKAFKKTGLGVFYGLVCTTLIACGAAPTKKTEAQIQATLDEQTTFTAASWASRADASDITVSWLSTFNDAKLNSLVSEAQANNRNLLAAAASVENAQALARQAGAALLPTVGLGVDADRSGSRNSNISPIDGRSVNLQTSWEIDLWGRIRNNQRAAVNSAKAAQADFRSAQQSLAATTAQSYFALIESNRQIQTAAENVKILEEISRIVNVQYKNGIVSAQDIALTRSDMASAREQLINLQGAQRNAARALEVLLGRYPSAELNAGLVLPPPPAAPPAGIPSELLERRPDLVAAERRVAAAFNQREVARVARLPSLSLTGVIGGSSTSLSDVLSPANTTWRLGASLLASVFDGGSAKAQFDSATANQKQTLADYGQSALTAFNEVETALDQGSVLKQRQEQLVIVEREAAEAYRIATLRYQEGEINLLDVLSIQQRLINAQSNLVTVNRLLLDQRVGLHLALGGDW